MSKTCANCRREVRDEACFCSHCGTAVSSVAAEPGTNPASSRACVQCQGALAADARFCRYCGFDQTAMLASDLLATPLALIEEQAVAFCIHCQAVIPLLAPRCPLCQTDQQQQNASNDSILALLAVSSFIQNQNVYDAQAHSERQDIVQNQIGNWRGAADMS
jgi:RNA polymerase subunit RPABC4/transcription elongation factor Spt4